MKTSRMGSAEVVVNDDDDGVRDLLVFEDLEVDFWSGVGVIVGDDKDGDNDNFWRD